MKDSVSTHHLRASDGWAGVAVRILKLLTGAFVALAVSAVPALAYEESISSTDPAATPSYSCPACHGLEEGIASPTVGPRSVPSTWTWDSEVGADLGSRKGPHGGYTSGTQKCQVCHTMHGAAGWEGPLLPEETIAATCYTCHDGTGGGGVYGVIYQRTGFDPQEASATAMAGTAGGVHRIGVLNGNDKVDVPGGNSSGTSLETTFTGPGGSMTCTDCHSPHNSKTVEPFVGDRVRSAEDITSDVATNRLLKQRPTLGTTDETVYGTGWCMSCHKGSHKGADPGFQHPYQSNDSLRNYSTVQLLAGFNTSATAGTGALGGSNFGYIMPDTNPGATGGHSGELPICQQCHEDSRVIGGQLNAADQFFVTNAQAFDAALDGDVAGNPRFQNFPHEAVNDGLLVESSPTVPVPDGLCFNCHIP